GYVPKTALSIVGIACTGALTIIYWSRMFRDCKRWTLALTIGETTMTLGFCIRISMHKSPDSLGIYILILKSPCASLAQDYVILPRIATWVDGEDCLFLSSNRILRIFVWSDVATFFLQAARGMTAAGARAWETVLRVAVVGLVIQLVSFLTFVRLVVVFGIRM
ncbi:hypothetical protein DB88DRAFT_444465, partial [Papiliotrema laurentii]